MCPVLFCPVLYILAESWRVFGSVLFQIPSRGPSTYLPRKSSRITRQTIPGQGGLWLCFSCCCCFLFFFPLLLLLAGWPAESISVAGHQKTLKEIHGLGLYGKVSMEVVGLGFSKTLFSWENNLQHYFKQYLSKISIIII